MQPGRITAGMRRVALAPAELVAVAAGKKKKEACDLSAAESGWGSFLHEIRLEIVRTPGCGHRGAGKWLVCPVL